MHMPPYLNVHVCLYDCVHLFHWHPWELFGHVIPHAAAIADEEGSHLKPRMSRYWQRTPGQKQGGSHMGFVKLGALFRSSCDKDSSLLGVYIRALDTSM